MLYDYKIELLLIKIVHLFTKNRPLKDIIMIESHDDFDCNGGAFYDYLIAHGYNKKYKIVWLLRRKYQKALPENVEWVKLHGPSIKKAYYVCLAKYFTFDCEVFRKVRKDQISIYCCHGAVGLKKTKGLMRLPKDLSYMLFPSDKLFAPILAQQYNFPYPSEKCLHLGYPYYDIICSPAQHELKKITEEQYEKVILWMPTFRKGGGYGRNDSKVEQTMGVPIIENEKMLKQLNEYLQSKNVLLIIKIHPKQDIEHLGVYDMSHIKVLIGETMKQLDLNTYRLIKDADALISDYSSAAYDYLLLNRPIGFVFSDLSSYKIGLCVDDPTDYLVGPIIRNYQEFIGFIGDVAEGNDHYLEKRTRLINELYDYVDNHNCERIAAFLKL